MNLAQSPHIPATGQRPSLKDIPWLAGYGLRGLAELIRARLIFSRLEARAIPLRNRNAIQHSVRDIAISHAKLARISYVLPRISDRLPWRSDCLIQAIAAQNWLLAKGGASEIQIGVENPKDGPFGAHAWLIHDGLVITGGDIEKYSVILADSSASRDSQTEVTPDCPG